VQKLGTRLYVLHDMCSHGIRDYIAWKSTGKELKRKTT